jgi:hypothetical protein
MANALVAGHCFPTDATRRGDAEIINIKILFGHRDSSFCLSDAAKSVFSCFDAGFFCYNPDYEK